MLITAKSKLGKKVRCHHVLTNEVMGTVFACDTKRGWIDMYLVDPTTNKLYFDRKTGKLATQRLNTDFVIATKRGRKLFRTVWTWGKPRRPIEYKLGPLPK